MKIKYINKRFSGGSLAIIAKANEIIAEYSAQGFLLTLRQLYYQFVARDLIANKQTEYKRLGGIINDGRLAGLIDWNSIEDRTRNLEQNPHWDGPEEILRSVHQSYGVDLWAHQAYRPEVWIEKEALVGVIEGVCRDLDVAYFACRGYSSQSEQWRASVRFRDYMRDKQQPIILHLGDHDPSGIDMTRDNRDRLDILRATIEVKRLALNMDQVLEHSPPPNPAKVTDSRFEGYVTKYGTESWELDALEPAFIADLIREHVLMYRDDDLWRRTVDEQEHVREKLELLSTNWNEVSDFLENCEPDD